MTDWTILSQVTDVIKARRAEGDADSSYVAKLFAKGDRKIAEKVGEEAVELVIASLTQDENATLGEAADLLFHMMVLLDARDLTLADVVALLAKRQGLSGLEEKAARASY